MTRFYFGSTPDSTPVTKNACKSATYKRISDPDRTQTYNLLIRSQILYSIKLRGHFDSAKIRSFN